VPRHRGGLGPVRNGVRVPGIYEDLLLRERERVGRSRTVLANPNDPIGGVFRRATHLLRALEAGEAVTVAASQLCSRRVEVPAFLRPANWPGGWWRVTPDDVVEHAGSPVVDRVQSPVGVREDRPT
jgi:hypothetical protein